MTTADRMASADDITLNKVMEAYANIRDHRANLKAQFDAEDTALEEKQQKLRAYLLSRMNEQGLQSISGEFGTAYRSLKTKPSVADWDALWGWMRENDGLDIMERRVKASFVNEYMEEHDGQLPPGVNVHREYEVSVRRPSSSSKSS